MQTIVSWCMECALFVTIILAILLVIGLRALDKEVRG